MNNEEKLILEEKYFYHRAYFFFRRKRKKINNRNLIELFNDEYNDILNSNATIQKQKVYLSLMDYNNYLFPKKYINNSLNNILFNLEIVKDTKLYIYLQKLINTELPIARDLLDRRKKLQEIKIYTKRKSLLIENFKKKNDESITSFINSLENWKDTFISNEKLYINGKEYGNMAICLILCENEFYIREVKIKTCSKDNSSYIGIYNIKNNKDLIIVDEINQIPDEVRIKINEKRTQ